MSDTGSKRKTGPSKNGPSSKRSKGTHGGKWKTPHHKAKVEAQIEIGAKLEVGDQGIWVTYARGMKAKVIREFKDLCEEYGAIMYGISPSGAKDQAHNEAAGDDSHENDIEASIQKELDLMKSAAKEPKPRGIFTPMTTGLDCVLFMKTLAPVQPEMLVLRICQDAQACPDPRKRKCRYVNRLTPVQTTDKATDSGIDRVSRKVLSPWFKLLQGPVEAKSGTESELISHMTPEDDVAASTYAIRHNIRNHTAFTSDEIIKKVAGIIDPTHKVNLSSPDRVILVEIYQHYCGISVVDGPKWSELRRYNIDALYSMTSDPKSAATKS